MKDIPENTPDKKSSLTYHICCWWDHVQLAVRHHTNPSSINSWNHHSKSNISNIQCSHNPNILHSFQNWFDHTSGLRQTACTWTALGGTSKRWKNPKFWVRRRRQLARRDLLYFPTRTHDRDLSTFESMKWLINFFPSTDNHMHGKWGNEMTYQCFGAVPVNQAFYSQNKNATQHMNIPPLESLVKQGIEGAT